MHFTEVAMDMNLYFSTNWSLPRLPSASVALWRKGQNAYKNSEIEQYDATFKCCQSGSADEMEVWATSRGRRPPLTGWQGEIKQRGAARATRRRNGGPSPPLLPRKWKPADQPQDKETPLEGPPKWDKWRVECCRMKRKQFEWEHSAENSRNIQPLGRIISVFRRCRNGVLCKVGRFSLFFGRFRLTHDKAWTEPQACLQSQHLRARSREKYVSSPSFNRFPLEVRHNPWDTANLPWLRYAKPCKNESEQYKAQEGSPEYGQSSSQKF